MATSAITWYGLVRAKALGEKLPEGVAIDNEGNLTLDPDKAMNGGAILPFAKDYKSSGLSMMIEILTGPLVGGTFCTPNGDGDWSNLFIAIDPNELVGLDEFKTKCSELIKIVKGSKKQKGFDEILVGGERSLKNRQAALESDSVEVEYEILSELGYKS
jgi:LDH2 family malate/lactate/ureidoglycolate dehydrogenase